MDAGRDSPPGGNATTQYNEEEARSLRSCLLFLFPHEPLLRSSAPTAHGPRPTSLRQSHGRLFGRTAARLGAALSDVGTVDDMPLDPFDPVATSGPNDRSAHSEQTVSDDQQSVAADEVFAEGDTPAPVGPRAVGTLVIYTARWVVVGRFLTAYAEALSDLGVAVELVDVDLSGADADAAGVAVLPTFVFHGLEGQITHTGAITLGALAHTCGVTYKAGGRPKQQRKSPAS